MLANVLFRNIFVSSFFLHISVGPSGPLQTAFERKIALPTAKKQAHATALTENANNLLKRPKTSKYLFNFFQKNQSFKNGKFGGLIYIIYY